MAAVVADLGLVLITQAAYMTPSSCTDECLVIKPEGFECTNQGVCVEGIWLWTFLASCFGWQTARPCTISAAAMLYQLFCEDAYAKSLSYLYSM